MLFLAFRLPSSIQRTQKCILKCGKLNANLKIILRSTFKCFFKDCNNGNANGNALQMIKKKQITSLLLKINQIGNVAVVLRHLPNVVVKRHLTVDSTCMFVYVLDFLHWKLFLFAVYYLSMVYQEFLFFFLFISSPHHKNELFAILIL